MLPYIIPLLAGLTIPVAATAAGPAACTKIATELGSAKVNANQLSSNYTNSLEYWNTIQDEYKPSCIVFPSSAQDVSVSLKAIRAAGSRFAIKAGGHNPNTFFSSVQAGVLLDLSSMTAKSYDPETTLATYEPGGVFGDVYEYFAQWNRTVVGARLAGVGTGLALGGGMSYLSPQYGLACDSFRELEIVLPDGQIVKASDKENPDLFFASRGGGGNAYGVVTKYTVQSRPIGEFWAGNLIYVADQRDSVIEAIGNFIQYNTDPKAAIIGTYEKLPLPDLNLNLDEAILMFLVYDGPNPGDAFKNFTDIKALIDTTGIKSYNEVVNMPVPMSTEISRGANMFRVGVHRPENNSYENALDKWRTWAEDNKGSYELLSIDFQPIPKSLTDASKAQGGNAMQMPDGPYFWLNYLITTPSGMTEAKYNAAQASYRDMIKETGNDEGLPLFINDANKDQNPLQTFSTFKKLQAIKKKYDPDNFFADYTGGWSFA
ncbi:FAD-binding type 2 [Penicillium pulvis]|uniref:FAD-binding type 2 n=1 Tax=Penicillium pulvis TaxID=1562058 RepID=UPI002546ABD7|nr:FAD-binding type 2 [Penicillium pulvis]KAJ5809462.1 FAD-binding type 2 [Penicillium pulvis]